MDVTRDAGAQVFKPQLLRRGMYRDGTKAAALVAEYEVPDEWLVDLKGACISRGLELMVTAYRAEDVPLIDPFVKRHKVAGFDSQNRDLIEEIAKTEKPIIVTFSLGNHEKSVIYPRPDVPDGSVALHGTSQYPTPPENMNMAWLRSVIGNSGRPWGLSDHSIGDTAAIMAVAMGATVIEKHIRHDQTHPANPDYSAAMGSAEFTYYVDAIREAETMLGDGKKCVMPGEWTHYQFDPTTGRRGGD